MSGEDIVGIIISLGLTAWIPIYFLFGGITKVVNAIKGNSDNKGISINVAHDDSADNNTEDDNKLED